MIELLYGKFIKKIEKIILKNSHNINNFLSILSMTSLSTNTVMMTPNTSSSTTVDTNARRPAIAATATRKESTTTPKKFRPPKPRKEAKERPAPGAAFKAAAQARKAEVAAEEAKGPSPEPEPQPQPKEFTPEQQAAYDRRREMRDRIKDWVEKGYKVGFFLVHRGKHTSEKFSKVAQYRAHKLSEQVPGLLFTIRNSGDKKIVVVAFPSPYIPKELEAGWASGQPLEFHERGCDATDGPVIRVYMHDASKPSKVAVPRLAAPKGGTPTEKQWDYKKSYPTTFNPKFAVLRVHGAKDRKLHNQPTGVKNYQFCASTHEKPCRENVVFFKAVRVLLAEGISAADLAEGWLNGTIKLPACCWRAHRTLQQCGVTEDVYEFFCEVFNRQKAAALAYEADLAAKKEEKAAAKAEAMKPDKEGYVSASAVGKGRKVKAAPANAPTAKAKSGGRFAALQSESSESEDEATPTTDPHPLPGAASKPEEEWSEEEWSEEEVLSENEWPEL